MSKIRMLFFCNLLLFGNYVHAGPALSIAAGAIVGGGAAAAGGATLGGIATAAIVGGAGAAASSHKGSTGVARVGFSIDGAGKNPAGFAEYKDSRKNIDVKFHADSHTYRTNDSLPSIPQPSIQDPQTFANPFLSTYKSISLLHKESEEAKNAVKLSNHPNCEQGFFDFKGNRLCYAIDKNLMIAAQTERYKYQLVQYTTPFQYILHHTPRNEMERRAMKSFLIEEGTSEWYFEQVNLKGIIFNIARTNTSREFWIQDGQHIAIAAPAKEREARDLKKAREEERRSNTQQPSMRNRIPAANRWTRTRYKNIADFYREEAFWAANESIKRAEVSLGNDLESSREASRTFISCYEKAVDLVRAAGDYVSIFTKEFSTIGGLENQRKYARGQISYEEYIRNILGDAALDAAAAAFGAKMGGGTGAALAVAVGNPTAIPVMSAAGATAGSAAAVVLSRASKALARVVASNEGSGNGKKGGGDEKSTEKKPSTEEVRRKNKNVEQNTANGEKLTSNENNVRMTREARWKQLANEKNSKLPKEVRETIRRKNGRDVYKEHGLELAHRPGKPAAQGNDYGDALPKTKSIHRNQHRFYDEIPEGRIRMRTTPHRDNKTTNPNPDAFKRMDLLEKRIKGTK